jgi:DNA-directed RNA polymerase specialized sigma24 family protein
MAGQLLGSRFALHDIDDVESFTAAIVQRSQFTLDAHQREELHVYLIETAWELSRNFRPGGISFSTYAGSTLRLRCVDWHRSRFGRQRWACRDRVYERPRVELVSLDADDDRLESSLAGSSLDDGEHRMADELRRLNGRARSPARPDDWLGDEAG